MSKKDWFVNAALKLVAAGLSVIPVKVRGEGAKRPDMHALRAVGVDGWKEFQTRHATEVEILAWAAAGAQGLALVTGAISRLVVIDFDGERGMMVLDSMGVTPHVLTPSGGAHLYVRHPGWQVVTAKAGQRDLPEGVDVRGDGGYVLLPPTTTSVGAYQRTERRELCPRDEIAQALLAATGLLEAPKPKVIPVPGPLPTWATDAERPRVELILDRAAQRVGRAGRNDVGFWFACQLRDNRYSQDEALALYADFSHRAGGVNAKGQPEAYTHQEYARSVAQAYRMPAREPWAPSGH